MRASLRRLRIPRLSRRLLRRESSLSRDAGSARIVRDEVVPLTSVSPDGPDHPPGKPGAARFRSSLYVVFGGHRQRGGEAPGQELLVVAHCLAWQPEQAAGPRRHNAVTTPIMTSRAQRAI